MRIFDTLNRKFLVGSPFKKDIILTFLSQIFIMLLAFGITKVASNKLTVDEFGQYNVIRRSASVLSFIMLAGMGITLPRYLAIYKGNGQYRKMIDLTTCSIAFVGIACFLVFLVCICFSNYLTLVITGTFDYLKYWIAFAYAFGLAISSLLVAYYRGVNDFKKYCTIQVLLQLLFLLTLIINPTIKVNNIFLLWFFVSFLLTLLLFFWENCRNRVIILRAMRRDSFFNMMKTISLYSSPRLLGDFFLFSFSAFPVIYLSRRALMSEVAYYSVGLTIINMATPIFSFLGVVLLPYVSGAISRGLVHEAEKLIRRLAYWYLLLALLITCIFWICMPIIIKIFFSLEYLVSTEISRILLLSVLPQSMYLLYRNPLDAIATFPYNTLILAVSCVVLFLLFAMADSLLEYSYSYVVASAIQGGLSFLVWLWSKNKKIIIS